MNSDTISLKNPETGKSATIRRSDITMKDWGFSFFVETELEAYKAAYVHRNALHGVKVEFAHGAGKWMVTVFNELAAKMKLA